MSEQQPLTAFICACGHSGTTLLATMLAMHPQIFVPLLETAIFITLGDAAAQDRVEALRRTAEQKGRTVVVEKTPRHLRHIPRIRRLVPGARFILMARDGRDVVASIARRLGGDYETAFGRWVDDNALLRAELDQPDAMLLRYEDLITALAASLAVACDFLGVAYAPEMLDYHRREHLWFGRTEIRASSGVGAAHKDHRNWQVNQPLFDGRGRWRSELPAAYVERFETDTQARTLMQAFGYPTGG